MTMSIHKHKRIPALLLGVILQESPQAASLHMQQTQRNS